MGILIDRFKELEVQECVKVHEIFCRVAKQFDELNIFYGWCKSIGIARSSEYPEMEIITMNKLEVMDEFIRDKSGHTQKNTAQKTHQAKEVAEEEEKEEEDMNKIKALPPPEGLSDAQIDVPPEAMLRLTKVIPQVDLLDLRDDEVTSEDQANKLALALFDGGGAPPASQSTWQAFNEDTADWEKALIESASCLSNQTTNLAGGFDMLLLDGMYNTQAALSTSSTAGSAAGSSGSGSSMAVGYSGGAAMLALPAAPTAEGNKNALKEDPFAASVQVAAPSYVQMAEMETKQKMLVEEQLMWQQYGRNGMQGQIIPQNNPYTMGGYSPNC